VDADDALSVAATLWPFISCSGSVSGSDADIDDDELVMLYECNDFNVAIDPLMERHRDQTRVSC